MKKTGITNKWNRKPMSPGGVLLLGFGAMIVVGAFLLNLPIASANGVPVGFLAAFFSSTSAVCVTGLSVLEVGESFSIFGQIVMLILIQLGGIGFMTATSMVYLLFGRRMTLKDRIVMKDSLNEEHLSGMRHMTKNVLLVTGISEAAGAVLLSLRLVPKFGVAKGIYNSVFLAVSAFCNAGFDVFGNHNSLCDYAFDPLIVIPIMVLITIGGLGFVVVLGMVRRLKSKPGEHFSLHAKIVLIVSAALTGTGFVLFLIFEGNNPKTLGADGVSTGDKILGAVFQSVTTRTAGFASIPQGDMMPASKIVTTMLMFIGASPSGTGGGIKTTTFVLLLFAGFSTVAGRHDTVILKRRIGRGLLLRAVTITVLALALISLFILIMSIIDQPRLSTSSMLFEIVSAFATVGLTTGITAHLSIFNQILLIITMFCGRVGLFTASVVIAKRIAKAQPTRVRYAQDRVMIG